MADCECLPGCPFFNDKMASKPATTAMMKKSFCQGSNTDCARYMIRQKVGREKVPADLFPNQMDRAKKLLWQDKHCKVHWQQWQRHLSNALPLSCMHR